MISWLKLHHEVIHDIKLRRFTAQEKWAWIVLLVLASESSDRGIIAADDDDIADACGFTSTQDWLYYRDKLIVKGMLDLTISGVKIANWDKRQYDKPSDKPEATKERKRKQREKETEKRAIASRDVTPESRLSHATEKIREDLEEIRKDLDQTQDPEVRDRKIEIAADPENPSRVGELENFDLKEPDPEPTEANWQRSWIRCPIEKQSPDQASSGSAQVTSSAAAPLVVENQKHPTAKTDDYYKSGGATKNKPELPADLEHIWVGLGRLDYLPALVDTCTRYLKSLEKPCSNSNAITYIANRIRDREWTAIELRLQEMAEYAQKRQNSESRVNHPQRPPEGFEGISGAYRHHSDDNAPKAFVDMNPQEQAEYKAAIAAMRSKTAGLEFSSIGEAIAQAAELGVAS